MRRSTILVGLVAAVALTAGRRAAASPAERLGEAWRAYNAGDYERALALGRKLGPRTLRNGDYADYLVAQSAFATGDHKLALVRFGSLAKTKGSRFAAVAAWRVADCEWALGRLDAARKRYEALLRSESRTKKTRRRRVGDPAVARFRIAEAHAAAKRDGAAVAGFRAVWMEHPEHPLAERAMRRARELGATVELSATERIARADRLTEEHAWREAVLELDRIGDDIPEAVRHRRDFQRGRTHYKMRRQYRMAGDLLLSVYEHVGKDGDWALFHGARGLSRAHFDAEAITWYRRVVEEFPRSEWAPEALYLSGWLEFNQGNYAACKPALQEMLHTYPRSRWASWARWYLAYAHYLLGEYEDALPLLEVIGRDRDKLEGGKGRYWRARSLQKLGRDGEALPVYRKLVGDHPFSWYALLSRARLKEAGVEIGVFGDSPRDPAAAPPIAARADAKLASDPLIQKGDELIAADMTVEAGIELRDGERAFLKRHGNEQGLAMLMDRYRKADNFNRPWMLAVVRGGDRALDAPPEGRAKVWWEHAYPLAYRELVEKYRGEGNNPPYYLYAIMRKESGFDPHTVSYADALGLLQMIPPTTRRVVKALGLQYTDDMLFDPELNIRAGSWYIGRLFHKFKEQVPVAAASYNGGPGAVMRWLDAYGDRPVDEYVELISFSQARGYGKKVTETYARYLYLYEGEVYEQPLELDREYVRDEIDY